ncbi:4-hydroxy-tetrahydrodipicolinate synthase [Alkalitalea saponilacus]|uniref:4-hydroxy-tetrahydrodipicolinate synthase n=1 Tax=Alkalitalea saponilacus TaxID=889453 RepID=A0A1T5GMI0_9BACT|nr:4-hydroxy-tetrahydrodipicolinate synthase [Alkalitalea saponilacus]ASB48272.1 4-hydroxy-tetrahydrodipicolinate synthase [Alkalitalea saponilacus]SKC09581.1 4-hydroxy-tetrahydrodipicolinate synthase [Alkalitalea saponilacus]
MKIDNLRGSIVAIVTPFKENGDIDFETYDSLIEWHIEQGTDGLVVCGTTGETPALSEDEDAMMIERTVKKVNGRIPVIAGTGSNSTKDCIKYSTTAKKAGVDALLVVAPYYNKPSDKGMYQHFSGVAKAVDLPIILYNVPGRTGSCISAKLAIRLANDHKNIVAVKEAGGSMSVFAELLANRPEGFKVYSGDDFLATSANLLGADGCISVIANLIPKDFHELMVSSLDGDVRKSKSLFFKYKALMEHMFAESNPLPVKTALALMGKVNETFRLPLCTMEDDTRKALENELKTLGLI